MSSLHLPLREFQPLRVAMLVESLTLVIQQIRMFLSPRLPIQRLLQHQRCHKVGGAVAVSLKKHHQHAKLVRDNPL